MPLCVRFPIDSGVESGFYHVRIHGLPNTMPPERVEQLSGRVSEVLAYWVDPTGEHGWVRVQTEEEANNVVRYWRETNFSGDIRPYVDAHNSHNSIILTDNFPLSRASEYVRNGPFRIMREALDWTDESVAPMPGTRRERTTPSAPSRVEHPPEDVNDVEQLERFVPHIVPDPDRLIRLYNISGEQLAIYPLANGIDWVIVRTGPSSGTPVPQQASHSRPLPAEWDVGNGQIIPPDSVVAYIAHGARPRAGERYPLPSPPSSPEEVYWRETVESEPELDGYFSNHPVFLPPLPQAVSVRSLTPDPTPTSAAVAAGIVAEMGGNRDEEAPAEVVNSQQARIVVITLPSRSTLPAVTQWLREHLSAEVMNELDGIANDWTQESATRRKTVKLTFREQWAARRAVTLLHQTRCYRGVVTATLVPERYEASDEYSSADDAPAMPRASSGADGAQPRSANGKAIDVTPQTDPGAVASASSGPSFDRAQLAVQSSGVWAAEGDDDMPDVEDDGSSRHAQEMSTSAPPMVS